MTRNGFVVLVSLVSFKMCIDDCAVVFKVIASKN